MRFFCIIFLVVACFSCSTQPTALKDEEQPLNYPSWFPDPIIPFDNVPTKLRVELGRRLFYDMRLSADGKTSCGSCHTSSAAFTDGKMTSSGNHSKQGKRNAPTLANLAWSPYFMAEGGVPSLEVQVLAPFIDSLELHMSFAKAFETMASDPTIVQLCKAAYNREPDAFCLTHSISAFERTMVSGDSRYDQVVHGKDDDVMTEEEKVGMQLFFSEKTKCASCHSGVFFTDFLFHNIGLYEEYPDHGKERENYQTADIGKFKTPTLRNVQLTGPYMHDGSMSTLEEVIDFYNTGGKPHPNRDALMSPLHLNDEEKKALVAFLNSLTDWNFVQNTNFLPLSQ